MSKTKTNRSQSPGKPTSARTPEILPPELPDSSDEKSPIKTVEGHRLVERKERFVISDDAAASEPKLELETSDEEDMEQCPHCEGMFAVTAWQANEEFCPGCGKNEDGFLRETVPELSEAEMLLQTIANDDEYSLRVDRLVDYEKDARTDSRAARRFCTTLKPVTLDFLDVVRRAYGGGAYLFSMYKKPRGLVKVWHDVIETPLEPIEPIPAATAQPSQARAPLDEVKATMVFLKDVRDLFVPRQTQATLPPSPPDPVADARTTVTMFKDLLDVAKDLAPEPAVAGDSATVVGDIAKLIDALGVKQWGPGLLQMIALRAMPNGGMPGGRGDDRQPAPPPGTQPAPPVAPMDPKMAAALNRVVQRVYVDLADNTEVDAAVESTHALLKAYPALQAQIAQILNASPIEVALSLAGQTGDPELLNMPHVTDWLVEFQTRLKEVLAAATIAQSLADDQPATTAVLDFIPSGDIEPRPVEVATGSETQPGSESSVSSPTVREGNDG